MYFNMFSNVILFSEFALNFSCILAHLFISICTYDNKLSNYIYSDRLKLDFGLRIIALSFRLMKFYNQKNDFFFFKSK